MIKQNHQRSDKATEGDGIEEKSQSAIDGLIKHYRLISLKKAVGTI